MAVGQLQMFSRTDRYTLTIPKTTAAVSSGVKVTSAEYMLRLPRHPGAGTASKAGAIHQLAAREVSRPKGGRRLAPRERERAGGPGRRSRPGAEPTAGA